VKTNLRKRAIPFEISANKSLPSITLASEKSLSKDWLLAEEEAAWENL